MRCFERRYKLSVDSVLHCSIKIVASEPNLAIDNDGLRYTVDTIKPASDPGHRYLDENGGTRPCA